VEIEEILQQPSGIYDVAIIGIPMKDWGDCSGGGGD